MAIHATAVVEDGATLGAGVEIGPFCHVGPRVTLGDGVRLLSHVSISGITILGKGCAVYPGAALGGDSQIRGNDFTEGRLEIGVQGQRTELLPGELVYLPGGVVHEVTAVEPSSALVTIALHA